MKVNVLKRDAALYQSDAGSGNLRVAPRIDPRTAPLATAREYQRAVVAAKVERIFAKPFVCALSGHVDSIKSMVRCHNSVADIYTGACDGEIRFWNLPTRRCTRIIPKAHEGFVNGLCVTLDDRYLFSCGGDGKVKQWSNEKYFRPCDSDSDEDGEDGKGNEGDLLRSGLFETPESVNRADKWHKGEGISPSLGGSWDGIKAGAVKPVAIFSTRNGMQGGLQGVAHHAVQPVFGTAGDNISIWNEGRSEPISVFKWNSVSADRYNFLRWSPSEHNLLLCGANDNSISLFDIRQSEGIQKIDMEMIGNAGCWNPMVPYRFTIANADHNCYTFDMRNLNKAANVHYGFTNSVLDVDYSPNGSEFVAGSFDQTIRIWRSDERRSREIYHTKRMQQVLQTKYSGDGKFVVSGSADMNLRIWKADASEKLGPVKPFEQKRIDYREALKEKFKHFPQIQNITQNRHIPKTILMKSKESLSKDQSLKRKEANRIANEPSYQQLPPKTVRPLRKTQVVQPAHVPAWRRNNALRKTKDDDESDVNADSDNESE